jgi:hypothetical protein
MDSIKIRRATFPEDSLKWVPRKRHNTRWPIEPKKEDETDTLAELQPSADFDAPASPEHVDLALKMDEQQMRRRSVRRLSRRLSLFPGEDSPRKPPMARLSPAKNSAPVPSPIKRPPITLSATKVADSPLRSFTVNATPTKVVLESPKISPPTKSPAKTSSSPIAPADDVHVAKATEPASPASPAPLMFDQPIPDVQAEPQHEARRRLSLQSARRSERGTSGASRLLALKSGRSSPNRRHSFTSVENVPVDAREVTKSRRNTMDVFCVGADALRATVVDEATDATVSHPKSGEVVEVDMKSSLDIFGRVNKTTDPAPCQPAGGELAEDEATQVFEPEPSSISLTGAVASAKNGLAASDDVSGSLPACASGAGVEAGADDAGLRQAAAGATAGHTQPSHHFTPEATPHAFETPANFTETDVFAPHDPEGLSTIFEEPSMVQDQSSDQAGSKPSAQVDEASASAELPCSIPGPVEHKFGLVNSDNDEIQIAADEQLMAESAPEAPPVVNMPTGHVVSVDTMSSPDSPPNDLRTSSIKMQQRVPIERRKAAEEMPHNSTNIDTDEDEISLLPEVTENKGSPSRAVASTPLPGTPITVPPTHPMDRIVTPDAKEHATQESSGFTPINGRHGLPPSMPPSKLQDEEETEAVHESDELDADEVVEEELPANADDDATVAIDEEMLSGEAPCPENDTLQLRARHDDHSEKTMLLEFVTRMTAGKTAAAAAAAAALAKKTARRSGSIGSITSSTGSPMAKPGSETPASRTPLGVKSPNSPSPAKKRKLELVQDDLEKDKSSQDPSDRPHDGPRLKRRRKRTDPVLETESATPSPEPDSLPGSTAAPGPRRSTRARSTRIALKPAAPSANSIALSMIPVRLPGMGAMDDAAMDAHLATMARQRSEEKDLAAITRGNTRKNKGGAVPPQVVLAMQAEDPSWRMRELKGVFEAKERRANEGAAGEGSSEEGKKGRKGKGKGVRWAEELVRYQSEEASVYRGMASQLLADVMMADEIAEAEPPAVAEPPVEKTARVAVRRAGVRSAAAPAPAPAVSSAPAEVPVSTRRTRSSRLPPPTPIKKLFGAEKPAEEKAAAEKAVPSLRTRAKSLPKLAPAPVPTASSVPEPTAATSTRSGMATRRTRITKLGMSGNGTPAPKRRGRTAA